MIQRQAAVAAARAKNFFTGSAQHASRRERNSMCTTNTAPSIPSSNLPHQLLNRLTRPLEILRFAGGHPIRRKNAQSFTQSRCDAMRCDAKRSDSSMSISPIRRPLFSMEVRASQVATRALVLLDQSRYWRRGNQLEDRNIHHVINQTKYLNARHITQRFFCLNQIRIM